MSVIHWGGGVRTERGEWLAGFPCCCSGKRAWAGRKSMTTIRDDVTCKRCLAVLAAAERAARKRRGA